jgi:hypothetical protein
MGICIRRSVKHISFLTAFFLLLSCSSSPEDPDPSTGTIEVQVIGVRSNAEWLLVGPELEYFGMGSETLSNMPIGVYTITWDDVDGYETPGPNPISGILDKNQSLVFDGTYIVLSGTIEIEQTPDNLAGAGWSVTGPSNESGSGDATLVDMQVGHYLITWDTIDGYITPPSEAQDLPVDGTIAFNGTYVDGFVFIPGGVFLMGAPEDELASPDRERPLHWVTLTRNFFIQTTEVTNQQYLELVQWAYDRAYVSATSISVKDNLGSTEKLLDLNTDASEISFSNGIFSLRDGGHGINPNHPVKEVTWYGAAAYCDWLSLREGLLRAYNHETWSAMTAIHMDRLVIGYPPKLNGNMPVVQEAPQPSLTDQFPSRSVTTSHILAKLVGTAATLKTGRILLQKKFLMLGVCMTCTAVSWNGATTFILILTMNRVLVAILQGRCLDPTVLFAEATGMAQHGGAAQHFGTGTVPTGLLMNSLFVPRDPRSDTRTLWKPHRYFHIRRYEL